VGAAITLLLICLFQIPLKPHLTFGCLLLCAALRPASGQPPAPQQPDPFAPLPADAVLGPQGPVIPGPAPAPRNSVVIPPLDAERVWTQMVDVMDDYFKLQAEQRVVRQAGRSCKHEADQNGQGEQKP
jgi:hypothetical protein